VRLPQRRRPESISLRLRIPTEPKKRIRAVFINDRSHSSFNADEETIDLSGCAGTLQIRAECS
jgi:hypothetical protein